MFDSVCLVLIDVAQRKVGLRQWDSTHPEHVRDHEGRLGFFTGVVRSPDGEPTMAALQRLLDETIPGFVADEDFGRAAFLGKEGKMSIFAVPTDLSGHERTRETDRLGQLARCCRRDEAVVRSLDFIRKAHSDFFVGPGVAPHILKAFAAFGGIID